MSYDAGAGLAVERRPRPQPLTFQQATTWQGSVRHQLPGLAHGLCDHALPVPVVQADDHAVAQRDGLN
jgi:hypothetical protein